ncbi:MAG: polysaccharide biosynthesis C-terminal domain-containing protein [Bacteroidales bacterium]
MIKKILHTLITKILSSGIGFLTIILISQCLGAEGKGEQSIFLFNIVLLLLFATLIGNSTLIYLTPRHKFSELFFPSLTWLILSLLVLFVIFYSIPTIIITHPIELFLVALFASITEINTYVLIGNERVKDANNLKLISPIVSISFLFVLTLMHSFTSSYYYVISLLLGYTLSLFYGIYLLKDEYLNLKLPSLKHYKEMFIKLFHLGAVKQVGSIAQQMNARLSFYLLTFYCGKKVLGVFSNGISISEAVLMFGISLALVQYSKLSNTEDDAYAKRLSLLMTKINILFTILALIFFSLLPSGVYSFIFGPEFSEVKQVIQVLSIGILFLSISSTFTQHFASKGNFIITTSASLIGLISTAVFGFWLVPIYGIWGAAITTVISYSITSFIEFYYFQKWTKTRLKDYLISKQDIQEFVLLISKSNK